MKIRASLIERIRAAAAATQLLVPLEATADHPGFTEEFLEGFGVRKADLKRLEVWGLSRRGYIREASGWKVRWLLIDPVASGGVDVQS